MDREKKRKLVEAYLDQKKIGGIIAVQNTRTGKKLIISTPDIQGYRNRFAFSQQTGSAVHVKLRDDWKKLGGTAFSLVVVETLEKKPDQSDKEFSKDIQSLLELWMEKQKHEIFY